MGGRLYFAFAVELGKQYVKCCSGRTGFEGMRPSWRVAEVWYARQASEATGESAASGAMETPGYQRWMPGEQLVSEEPAQTYELCLLLTAELEKWELPKPVRAGRLHNV